MTGDRLLHDDEVETLQLQRAPTRFAERLTSIVAARRKRRSRLRWVALAIPVGAALLLALFFRRSDHGTVIAEKRVDVRIGARAAAVLETGARVSWIDNDTTQSAGEVFYRVEPGAAFRVHTKLADVVVEGTCFVVRVDEQESNVVVYEGRVTLSHGASVVHLGAGEKGRADESGVHGVSDDDPLLVANANLADAIRDYKRRLESVDAQKKSLETRLAVAEHRLAVETDGASALPKAEYDLSQDDWRELARQGRVKVQLPCQTKFLAVNTQEPKFDGLSPDDAKLVAAAHQRSNERVWDQLVRPLCAQLVDNPALADRLGMATCLYAIMESASPADAKKSIQHVADMRAGIRPMPGPNEQQDPIQQMLLGVTGEAKAFENDLARSLGPDEAHRITYFDDPCMATFGF